jgi:hypothetical protein
MRNIFDVSGFWFAEFERFELSPAIKRLERTGPVVNGQSDCTIGRLERLERPTSYGGHLTRAPEFASVSCYLSLLYLFLNCLIIIRCAEKRLPQMR